MLIWMCKTMAVGRELESAERYISGSYELHARVVEDPDAGRREVCADEQLRPSELGAQVRQRRLGPEVLA
jgi:hypothetical protein